MGNRTAVITLDGVNYTVRAFNLKELQEVGDIISSGNANVLVGMKILAVALRRAEPKIDNPDALEPTLKELNAATEKILELAGIETTQADPQAAAPATN